MKTELLLREAFEHDEAGFEPAPLEAIQRRVAGRRRRNMGTLAAAVVALVVGIGLALGPMQAPETSDVFVSDDTGGDGVEIAEGDSAQGADPDAGEPSTFVALEDPAFDGRRPNVRTVVEDGNGGFVGMFFVSALDQRGPTTVISRSATGEDWDAVGRWDLGDRVVREVRDTGDEWMAVLEGPTVGYVGPYGPFDPLNTKVEIAFTSDFENWSHHKVRLDLSERAPGTATSFENVSVQPVVMGGGRHGDVVALQVAWFFDVAWELQNEACGSGRDERGVFLIRCDGSIDIVLDGATFAALGVAEPEWYIGLADQPLELVGSAPAAPVRVTPAGFVAVNDAMDALLVSTDGRAWETIAELGAPERAGSEAGEWQWALLADDAGDGGPHVMLAGGSLDHEQAWFAKVDTTTGDVAMSTWPVNVDLTVTDGMIDHGPAGWGAVVTVRPTSSRGITRDDLTVVRWPEAAGNAGAPFVVAPPVAAPSEGYRITPSNELIDMGLFGELRIRKPGSDDILFDDVDWRDLEYPVAATQARAAAPDAVLEADGWRVAGDPFRGPLVITTPEGAEHRFDDGFAFTNGDFADGVELIGARADEANAGSLAFFVEGDLAWSVPFVDVVAALGLEPDADLEPAGEPGDAWILRSVDGVAWEIAWSEQDAGFGSFPQLIVGDDEVVVRRFTYPDALHTVALDP